MRILPLLATPILAAALVPACAGPASAEPSATNVAESARCVFLVPRKAGGERENLRFLSAVPPAAARNGKPVVISVDLAAPWRPEVLDFLARYQPREIWTVGAISTPPAGLPCKVQAIEADTPEAAAAALALQFFGTSSAAVLCDPSDRAALLEAAVLGGRLGIPLLPVAGRDVSPAIREALKSLGVRSVYVVGKGPAAVAGLTVEQVGSAADVVRCLERHGKVVGYIAAVNADDGHAAHAPDMSFAAALLAVGREGAIAPTPQDVQWKKPVAAETELKESPRGAHASSSGWHRGTVKAGEADRGFILGTDPATGRVFMQVDLNGDGDFGDPKEKPVKTGDEIRLGGRKFAVDLDADENARTKSMWLTSPTAGEITSSIRSVRSASAKPAPMLCLVGWPQTLPMAIIGDAMGVDADLVSDIPLAQTDADPFVDVAYARFIGEDVASATLQASRGLVVDDFKERGFASRFATAEWATPSQPVLESVGLTSCGHHPGTKFISPGSPLGAAGWIVHASHAMWTVLGDTYAWDTQTLLSPCFVQSDGCSTAALDMDDQCRSAPAQMMRNGALAFAGAARRNTAEGELFTTEFGNAIARGLSVGEAHRAALNAMMVAMLSRGQAAGGPYHYQLYIASAYGDPAIVFMKDNAGRELKHATHLEVDGMKATVVVGGPWQRSEYPPVSDWNCPTPRIFTWRGLGVGAESTWYPAESRNQDDLIYTAEARTTRKTTGVEAADDPDHRWKFDGKSYIDDHEDGTRSIYWRVRLVDFDMNKGEIRAQRDRAEFRLVQK